MGEYLRPPTGYNTNYVSLPKNKRKRGDGPETTAQGTQRLEWLKGGGAIGNERVNVPRPEEQQHIDYKAPARDVYSRQQRGGVKGKSALPLPPTNVPGNKLSIADFYAQIAQNAARIAAIKQKGQQQQKQGDNPVSRPVLDEELKAPNSDRNPSNLQGEPTNTNPVKTPGSDVVPKGNDFNDSSVSPLSAHSDANDAPTQTENAGIIRSKGKGSTHVVTDGSAATLTNTEFQQGKVLALGGDSTKGGETERPLLSLTPQQDRTPDDLGYDRNPSTTYSAPKPTGVVPVTQGGNNSGKWMEGGDIPTSGGEGGSGGGNDTLHGSSTSSDKNMGLLGMGALLGSAFIVYGATEGISSQYVVGASALTAYCMTHVLGLNV